MHRRLLVHHEIYACKVDKWHKARWHKARDADSRKATGNALAGSSLQPSLCHVLVTRGAVSRAEQTKIGDRILSCQIILWEFRHTQVRGWAKRGQCRGQSGSVYNRAILARQ